MPTHLPPDEMLADYACGVATPGVSLLVAAHLPHSPESAERVRTFESVGGALLSAEAPAPMPEKALDDVLAQIASTEPDAISPVQPKNDGAPANAGPIPQCVLDVMQTRFEDIPWKFRLPGVSVCDIDGFGDPDEAISLLRARPGSTVPQHTHEGSEMTLVLQGVLLDEGVEYQSGDIAMNDEHDDHRPRILGDEVCYCLIVQRGGLRFTGTFSRILNYLGE